MRIRNAEEKDSCRFNQKTIRMVRCQVVSKSQLIQGNPNIISKTYNKEEQVGIKKEQIHLRKGRSC